MEAIAAEGFRSYLAQVQRRIAVEPMPETMETARKAMQAGHDENFLRQSTREGQPWAPRKPPTGSWPILHKTGALHAAATGMGAGAVQESDGRSATVGVDTSVNVPGGGVHAAGFHQSGTARMPARPWLGASDEIEDAIGEVIADAGLKWF